MPRSNADFGRPGGLDRPGAGISPGDFRRSEYGTVILPTIVSPRPDHVLETAPQRGLKHAPGTVIAGGLGTWQGVRAPVEYDAFSECRR